MFYFLIVFLIISSLLGFVLFKMINQNNASPNFRQGFKELTECVSAKLNRIRKILICFITKQLLEVVSRVQTFLATHYEADTEDEDFESSFEEWNPPEILDTPPKLQETVENDENNNENRTPADNPPPPRRRGRGRRRIVLPPDFGNEPPPQVEGIRERNRNQEEDNPQQRLLDAPIRPAHLRPRIIRIAFPPPVPALLPPVEVEPPVSPPLQRAEELLHRRMEQGQHRE